MGAEAALPRTPIALRLPHQEVEAVDRYARTHSLTRTEAFLRLLRKGLAAEQNELDNEKLDAIQRSLDRVINLLDENRSPLSLADISNALSSTAQSFSAIRRAYLFGSYARGEATPESDVDLRLELDDASSMSLYDLAHLQKTLERTLGKPVDLVTASAIKNQTLADAIERDKVLLYDSES